MKTLSGALALLLLFIVSCSRQDNPVDDPGGSVTGTITTGTSVQGASQPIGATGGTISISKPGDSLDGFRLIVPPGSYPETRTFTVSYAPILSQSFSTEWTPASPLIHVDNGGGYADSIMAVRIPVKLAANEFGMAFYYDRATGTLEAMPLLAEDSVSITVATRHFSEFFVLKWIKDALFFLGTTNSGFEPKKDDWEFYNRGSIIAADGHCSGQSVSAMWYFAEKYKKQGKQRLYGLYDNYRHSFAESPTYGGSASSPVKTPTILEDDVRGYKFASVVQVENSMHFTDVLNLLKNSEYLGAKSGALDWLTFLSIKGAIINTHEPQWIGLSHFNRTGGHAIIAYKVEGTKIYVADPNFPGQVRTINFNAGTGHFEPYVSGATASQKDDYDWIVFYAKYALIDKSTLERHWSEFEQGTIGVASSPLRFFNYSVTLQWKANGTSGSRTITDGSSITVSGYPAIFSLTGSNGSGSKTYLAWCQGFNASFERDKYGVPFVEPTPVFTLDGRGKTLIGVYVVADVLIGNLNYHSWLDFIWIEINVQ